MAVEDADTSPIWDDLDRQIGQLFMVGFDGTAVNDQIRTLIEDHHVGSILLTAENLKSAEEATRLALDLQNLARRAGHRVPLAIALDQENGGINSLSDRTHIRQFPSAMGMAATGSRKLAREVAKTTGHELNAVGVNWILGPVLDVLNKGKNQALGVRAISDDAQEVSAYGVEFLRGYHEADLAACGKHFPSYGDLEFPEAQSDFSMGTDFLERLSQHALVPFQTAISQGLDAIMVGGAAMSSRTRNVMNACLSERIVQDLLRKEMGFKGVVVSGCLETDALRHNDGGVSGTVMAAKAGCDILVLCRSFAAQQGAIKDLRQAIENGVLARSRVEQSLRRILDLKSRCTSWEKALNPAGIDYLTKLQPLHARLSTTAYDESVTVVRDQKQNLPLSRTYSPKDEILLLTPLVKPLPASVAYRMLDETSEGSTPKQEAAGQSRASIMAGEPVFGELGRAMSRQHHGRVLHTSYTANGLRPMHEDLIDRAGVVVVVTADAGRNLYQIGFTKHVSMVCRMSSTTSGDGSEKPVIVVSVSSPCDLVNDQSIGTYICTYDFTEMALQGLVKALYGELRPTGVLPGS